MCPTADAYLQESGLPDMLWGELYAARQRHPLSVLWWRRDDVCELLLREGHAMLPDAEDFDWLQVSCARLQALKEAEEKAAREAAEAEAEAERQAQLEQEKAASEAARLERAARILSDEADRKAARDAKYAARKARIKG